MRQRPGCGNATKGVLSRYYVENRRVTLTLKLAPQVGFEPTTLRLTAESQGEAARTQPWRSLKTGGLWSWGHSPLRMASKKSSYKSSYSQFPYSLLPNHRG